MKKRHYCGWKPNQHGYDERQVLVCINIYPALLSPRPPARSAASAAPDPTAVSGCLRSSCGPPSEREPPPSAPASDAPPGPGTGQERGGARLYIYIYIRYVFPCGDTAVSSIKFMEPRWWKIKLKRWTMSRNEHCSCVPNLGSAGKVTKKSIILKTARTQT